MKKVCVIGHFGFGKNLANGQTIKTQIVVEELENKIGIELIECVDTCINGRTVIGMLIAACKAIYKCENVIMLPAQNGVLIFAPLLYIMKILYKKRIHYIVIGGWLPEYLKNKKIIRKCLKEFDAIYVETNSMRSKLVDQGILNVCVMPNCKKLDILKKEKLNYTYSEPLKLCTFSRVIKEKGIEDAIKAVIAINQKYGRVIYTLDIYGQIDKTYIERFKEIENNSPDYIRYCGCVEYNKTTETLKNYYLLLFPTFYAGEGFAGTLIDAYAAGVPVISSDWKYNSEIVKEGITGFLYQTRNIDELKNRLDGLVGEKEKINSMKINCIMEAKKYTPEKVIEILINNLK